MARGSRNPATALGALPRKYRPYEPVILPTTRQAVAGIPVQVIHSSSLGLGRCHAASEYAHGDHTSWSTISGSRRVPRQCVSRSSVAYNLCWAAVSAGLHGLSAAAAHAVVDITKASANGRGCRHLDAIAYAHRTCASLCSCQLSATCNSHNVVDATIVTILRIQQGTMWARNAWEQALFLRAASP